MDSESCDERARAITAYEEILGDAIDVWRESVMEALDSIFERLTKLEKRLDGQREV